jgi:hypothetical protein
MGSGKRCDGGRGDARLSSLEDGGFRGFLNCLCRSAGGGAQGCLIQKFCLSCRLLEGSRGGQIRRLGRSWGWRCGWGRRRASLFTGRQHDSRQRGFLCYLGGLRAAGRNYHQPQQTEDRYQAASNCPYSYHGTLHRTVIVSKPRIDRANHTTGEARCATHERCCLVPLTPFTPRAAVRAIRLVW